MLQRNRDVAAGLNTAGFISGYRGSPLGAFDQSLWRARKFLAEHHVKFQPGINEDIAATSIWGTQQLELFPGARYDGVFAMWYGKGPGVDRCGDVFKHANSAGTSRHGGVLVLAGDELVGIISERDYARKVVLKGKFSKDTRVREIMSEKVVCVYPEQTIEDCMALMTAKRVRHLPVPADDKLVGVISIGDAVKAVIADQEFLIEELEKYITGSRKV